MVLSLSLTLGLSPHHFTFRRGRQLGRQLLQLADQRPRLQRVLPTDPGMGVLRHADAGYSEAIEFAGAHGPRIPHLEST